MYEDVLYEEGATWYAGENLLDATDASLAEYNYDVPVDAWSWWTADGGDNTAGMAWIGMICDDPYNTNINEMQTNVVRSAYVS